MHFCFEKPRYLHVIVVKLPLSHPVFIPGLIMGGIAIPATLGLGVELIQLVFSTLGWLTLEEAKDPAERVGLMLFCMIFLVPITVAIRETDVWRYYFDRVNGDVRPFYRSFKSPLKEHRHEAYPLCLIKTIHMACLQSKHYTGAGYNGSIGTPTTTSSYYLNCYDETKNRVSQITLTHPDRALAYRIASFVEATVAELL
ncbi:MAG: hypothetical protein AAFR31_17805 [Cyanobacteria bacterium J06627_8]